jgi:DNA-binding Xre family transcriptional regulator
MTWKSLQDAIGVSPSVMAKLQKNRNCNTETIDKVCTYLHVQPGEIMEWVESENDLKKREIQSQIEALQKQLSEIE